MELLGGRYARERVIGRGGMGSVWVGTDNVLQRPVALKELAPDAASAAAREARLAATVSHPHVVPVYDLLMDEDRPWLVMEYVDGPSLSQFLVTHGALSPDAAAVLLRQVADALQAAHDAGVVHRDVKPSNILLAAPERALLTDFGVARNQDATLTNGVLTASPAYLAPEVAIGKGASPASDVWSLGATLFHMLAGHAPYEVVNGNVLGVIYRIIEEDPPTTDRAGWLAPLLRGTMTKDPTRRWTLAQVRSFLDGRDVRGPETTAVIPGVGDTAERPAVRGVPVGGGRRHRALIVAAATIAAIALIGGIAWLVARNSGKPQAGASGHATASSSAGTSPSQSAAASPTTQGVTSFVQTYLQAAAKDPGESFAMLTPEFQQASGELAGYSSFWGDVSNIRDVRDVKATLSPLGVSYRYTYNLRGEGKRTEHIHLELVYENGTYLISGGSSQRAGDQHGDEG